MQALPDTYSFVLLSAASIPDNFCRLLIVSTLHDTLQNLGGKEENFTLIFQETCVLHWIEIIFCLPFLEQNSSKCQLTFHLFVDLMQIEMFCLQCVTVYVNIIFLLIKECPSNVFARGYTTSIKCTLQEKFCQL